MISGMGPDSTTIFAEAERHARSMSLVDLDPELFGGLGPLELARVREIGTHVVDVEAGAWDPQFRVPSAALGLLVLEGVLVRTVGLGDEVATELVGPGDVIRPWEASGDDGAVVPCSVGWFALQRTRLAVLGRGVALAAADCPHLVTMLLERTARRNRSQGILTAVAHMKRVEVRVLLLLWHMAERWGKVTRDGVVVPIRLTHQRIAVLVGAQRPSVTAALSRMASRGWLVRTPARGFVLTHASRDELEVLCRDGERAVTHILAA